MVHNAKPGETLAFSRIEMSIGIDGVPVQAAYDATFSSREKANSIKEAHKEAYRRGGPGENFLKPFMGARLELGRAGETLKAEIASAARAVCPGLKAILAPFELPAAHDASVLLLNPHPLDPHPPGVAPRAGPPLQPS